MEETSATVVRASSQRKVFTPVKKLNKIPASILENKKLEAAINKLPKNYNFEVLKSIWRIQETNAKSVALQMPEGLLMFATTIADIIKEFTGADVIIMGDVTYGACCVDDYTASALGVDLLIHYGHSCLIPINTTSSIKVLYVFVDISIDSEHFIETIKLNFDKKTRLILVSTIQFIRTLQSITSILTEDGYNVNVPQSKPLSPGEILGCTAPTVKCGDVIIYLGDGRFHLEAAMIANPKLKAYRYDPYEKSLTQEDYDHETFYSTRKNEVFKAMDGKCFGFILGTLGRQGSLKVFNYLLDTTKKIGKTTVPILLSEIFPAKLNLFRNIDAYVQVACPRLSIDWGKSFSKPLLTPYELNFVTKNLEWNLSVDNDEYYKMDFYANDSLGPWTPNHKPNSKVNNKCCGKCLE